jgi:hypothetical protein
MQQSEWGVKLFSRSAFPWNGQKLSLNSLNDLKLEPQTARNCSRTLTMTGRCWMGTEIRKFNFCTNELKVSDINSLFQSTCIFNCCSLVFSLIQIYTCFGLTCHLQVLQDNCYCQESFRSWYCAAAMKVFGFMVLLLNFLVPVHSNLRYVRFAEFDAPSLVVRYSAV